MLPVLDAALRIGSQVIERLWPDPTEQEKAKLALLQLQQEGSLREIEASMQVVVAEAKSEHWLTSTWRPILMLCFGAVVVNNLILAPYIAMVFSLDVRLDLPPEVWELLNLGIGGYLAGRTIEKGLQTWRQGGK